MSSQVLRGKLSVLFGVVCHYFTKRTDMASKQGQAFRMCFIPCPRYLTGGDTHILCVACLGKEHAHCIHCDVLPLWTPRSRLPFFREDTQACVPQGSGSAVAWGSQRDLSAEVETGTAFSLLSPDRFSASSQGWETLRFLPP